MEPFPGQEDWWKRIDSYANKFPEAGIIGCKLLYPLRNENEKYYPLTIYYCVDCFLVQVSNVISVDVLFREKYFFFSSAISTLVDHFKEFADEIYEIFLKDKYHPSVLEIGSNDGVLLKPLLLFRFSLSDSRE